MIDSASGSWEDRLKAVASSTAYPSTPDLWPSVSTRLGRAGLTSRRPWRRWAVAVAAVVLALVAGLLVTPESRAAVFRVLQIGVVRIFVEPTTPTPVPATPLPTSTSVPTPVLRPPLDLAGQTTLAQAEKSLGFALPLPGYPPGLGPPDFVFAQDLGGPLAILVWLDPKDPTAARLALHVLGPATFAGKSNTRVLQETEVNGKEALWLEGTHFLVLRNGSMDFRSLVTGNVLVWSEGSLTYRLETNQPLEEAVHTAESLR